MPTNDMPQCWNCGCPAEEGRWITERKIRRPLGFTGWREIGLDFQPVLLPGCDIIYRRWYCEACAETVPFNEGSEHLI